MAKQIAIIDYGAGNLRSVEKAFAYLGFEAVVTDSPKEVLAAAKVVLPGVGAFSKSMESLSQAGMIPVVREVIKSGRPFLGICLGLQLLFEASTESFDAQYKTTPGMGILLRSGTQVPQQRIKGATDWLESNSSRPRDCLVKGCQERQFCLFCPLLLR